MKFEEAVKIYKKALQLSKDYLSDNEQLIQNLASVVSSATEQINNEKKSSNESKRQKYEREMSENKKELYKELAKNTEKLKNLPKLRISAGKEFRSSVDPLNVSLCLLRERRSIRSSWETTRSRRREMCGTSRRGRTLGTTSRTR